MSVMPSDIKQEEKAIGGMITYSQFFCLLAGIGAGLIVGFLVSLILGKTIGKVIGFFALFSGVPFAFYRPYKMTYFRYLVAKQKFKKKPKQLTKY